RLEDARSCPRGRLTEKPGGAGRRAVVDDGVGGEIRAVGGACFGRERRVGSGDDLPAGARHRNRAARPLAGVEGRAALTLGGDGSAAAGPPRLATIGAREQGRGRKKARGPRKELIHVRFPRCSAPRGQPAEPRSESSRESRRAKSAAVRTLTRKGR